MKIFSRSLSVLLPVTIFLLPILFLPFSLNYFTTPKQALIILATLIALSLYAVETIRSRRLTLPHSPLTLPLFLFVAAILTNLIIFSEGRTESLFGVGSLLLALPILSLLILTHPSPVALIKNSLLGLILSTTILAIHSIAQLTFLHSASFLPSFMQTRAFTPTGSPLVTITLLCLGSLAALGYILRGKGTVNYLMLTALSVQLIAVVGYVALMLPGQPLATPFLPYAASWSICLDTMKSVRSVFLGVGLSNFSLLYTTVKPLFLNNTVFWNIIPSSASSEFFQLLATGGIIVLGTFALVCLQAFGATKTLPDSPDNLALKLTLGGTILSFILLPASITTYALFFLLLALSSSALNASSNLNLDPPVHYVVGGIFVLLVGLTAYYYGLLLLADYHMSMAAKAVQANNGKTTYQEHINAITLVPSMASYRLSYSQVNLSLAASLSQKKDLTEADRTQVATLVQQSIREGQAVTTLFPDSSQSWKNLATIYKNLINVADGSDKFAIDYYTKAVNLDSGNPALHVEYGGLFYQLAGSAKDADTKGVYIARAASEFQTAIQLKSDYSNAYYNLGKALEMAGNYASAATAMEKVVSLLSPTSADYATATTELSNLKSKASTATESATSNKKPAPPAELSTPSPLPSPISGGPIVLPNDSPAPSLAPNP